MIGNYIEECTDSDLHSSFVDIVNEIFGRGQDKGWELDKLKTRVGICFLQLLFFPFNYWTNNSNKLYL